MRKPSGGLGLVLGLAGALVSACGSSSNGAPPSASGAAGIAAGGSASGGTSSTGGTSSAGGTAGGVSAGEGGASTGGTQGSAAGRAGDAGGSGNAGGSGDAGGAQNTFVDQINFNLGGPPLCLPFSLPVGLPGSANEGRVSCVLAELKPGSCDCAQTARAPLGAAVLTATTKKMQSSGSCGGSSSVSCDSLCGCEIIQTPGVASDQSSELYACQNELAIAASVNGVCVIDQMLSDASGAPAPLGNPAIVAQCPSNNKRLLRAVGAGTPASGATTFIDCTSSP